ncbi:hypothetical protein E3N88_13073 [Mikania micrantha]|uniref:Endonuclease/exonuclease/phosphatase domain-containing protein n=1 Tax=Mikania micrantha TaxID=192012 RepID=A0A5N6P9A1_9ASTR|nr:hypothetical protein E3N88_13073 [Mikania micrantha]
MNFLSLNIRGVGGAAKPRWVKSLVVSNKIGFLAIQETQLSDSSKIDLRRFWKGGGMESDFVNAVGRSGGLLCIWNSGIFGASKVVKDRNFLLISGMLIGNKKHLNIMNVYAPQEVALKKILWTQIRRLILETDGYWVVMGDFKSVRVPEERLNSQFDSNCATEFNNFILETGLQEFSMKGAKFTYCQKQGRKLSKIDRILVSLNYLDDWSDSCCMVLKRSLSDHSPVILKSSFLDYGPRPFRVFNSWFDKEDFDWILMEAVSSFNGSGNPAKRLHDKLKHIKECIKCWAKKTRKKKRRSLKLQKMNWRYLMTC